MRYSFNITLAALMGLSVHIMACAEGSSFNGEGGSDNTGGSGNTGGSSNTGGAGGEGGGNNCTEEICDGIDNDCDGTVDEVCDCKAGETQPCYSGPTGTENVGQCKGGTQSCDPATNKFGPCTGEVLPGIEICNGSDENCDGTPDDGLPDQMCGVGACLVVAPTCANGMPAMCVPGMPSPELCDGIDNDCDQLTDETFPENGQTCDTGQLGVCGVGASQCKAGVLTCVQNTMASGEACDGLDNDCNGMVDDNLPGLGGACSTGALGVCSAGTLSCQGGKIDCFPNVPASAEMCDGLDNDCDGMTDEGNPQGGGTCDTGQMGACAQGTQTCMGGMLVCQSNGQAQAEVCNGIDDNCNGQADEGNPGGGQSCTCGGTASCTNGQLLCSGCNKEVDCNNGVDDDGDGAIDCADSQCALGCNANLAACPAGQKLLVLSSGTVNLAVNDNSSVTSVLSFSETMTVKRVVLQVNVTHPWIEDIDISLKSPSNTNLDISSDNGSSGTNYTNTIFNDTCVNSITSGTAPFNGCYKPEQLLSGFVNQPLKGNWTLTVADDAIFDTGTLNSWTLAMCVQ